MGIGAIRHESRLVVASDDDSGVTVRERPPLSKDETAQPERPPLYAVILINDDYTPRLFVTHILKQHFGLDADTAHTLMIHAHRYGEARIGAWAKDVAETKMHNAEKDSREHGHPLGFKCHSVDS